MYLHLGKNIAVLKKDIIAICDLDNVSWSHLTRTWLTGAEKAGQVVSACDDLPKSVVVCGSGGGQVLYLSQFVPSTLVKRAETVGLE